MTKQEQRLLTTKKTMERIAELKIKAFGLKVSKQEYIDRSKAKNAITQ